MDRVSVLAGHLAGGRSTAVAPAPTAAAAADAAGDLAAFCPRTLHRYMTPENYELRQAIKDFFKVCEWAEGRV